MQRSLLHQLALFASLLAILSMITGAIETSNGTPAGQQLAQIPLAVHRGMGEAALLLALVMAVGVFTAPAMMWLRGLAVAAVALGAAAGFSYGVPVAHACIAPLFFAAVATIASLTSASWQTAPEPFDAKRWPALRKLALMIPIVVVLQIMLGAAYRHKAMGVLPHLAGAMLVALSILGLSVFILQTLPGNRGLRSAAILALTVTLIQITLGMAVLVMGMLDAEGTLAALLSAVAHVTNGALTLSTGSLLAIQVQRAAGA